MQCRVRKMLHFDNGKVCEESARYRIRKIAVYGD